MDWIFQVDPRRYDIYAAIAQRKDETWAMNQHRALVTPGDRVFFWRSGKDAALVAIARVTTGASERADRDFGRYYVGVVYEYRIDPPMARDEVFANPVLSRMRVFKGQQGTNFLFDAEAAATTYERLREQNRLIPVAPRDQLHMYDREADTQRTVFEALRNAHNRQVAEIQRFLGSMDDRDFEWLVAAVLVRAGFTNAEVTRRSGDKGIDVRATIVAGGFAPMLTYVQAKRTAHVHSPTVQALRGACPSGYAAMLVTSGDFSEGAKREAEDQTKHNAVTLVNGQQLAQLMIRHGVGVDAQREIIHTLALHKLTRPYLQELTEIPQED